MIWLLFVAGLISLLLEDGNYLVDYSIVGNYCDDFYLLLKFSYELDADEVWAAEFSLEEETFRIFYVY